MKDKHILSNRQLLFIGVLIFVGVLLLSYVHDMEWLK